MTHVTTEALHVFDLFSEAAMNEAVAGGYVRQQTHPDLPLTTMNYTERAQYERAWNDVTSQCRGFIVSGEGQVVARPWRKFFNYGEDLAVSLDLAAPAEVTDKKDGSLGILYPVPGGYAIATRGSFTSEQARHATEVLRARYAGYMPPPGVTVLLEIIYRANRIVCDYGDTDDLILLGAVDIRTGTDVAMSETGWPGPRASIFSCATLADALAMPPRENAEGLVVRLLGTGVRVKIKQADYVSLHRILTGTNARTVWEFLAVNACRHLIARPKHWGSRLGIDPDRAAEILDAGPQWQDRLLEGVPDEFHTWLRNIISEVTSAVAAYQDTVTSQARLLMAEHGAGRKAFAQAVQGDPDAGVLFMLYDGRDITTNAWKAVYPAATKPFAQQGEDVA